jgi:hypothetical protein
MLTSLRYVRFGLEFKADREERSDELESILPVTARDLTASAQR